MLGEIVRHGRVRRGRIGIGAGTVPLPRRLVLHHGLDQVHGAGVLQVLPGGPADEAGLLTGNIVIAAGGIAVNGAGDLVRLLDGDMIGRAVPPDVLRRSDRRRFWVAPSEN